MRGSGRRAAALLQPWAQQACTSIIRAGQQAAGHEAAVQSKGPSSWAWDQIRLRLRPDAAPHRQWWQSPLLDGAVHSQRMVAGLQRLQLRGCSSAAGPPAAFGGREAAGRRVVAVGISGGVDSAVAAWLLQRQGHDMVGVFMRNWDEAEERGDASCSMEADRADAARVCAHLRIPLHEADFVREYWMSVFAEFVAQCGQGLTPNPDLACNRHIKFGALLAFCRDLGADAVATGHYARLRAPPDGGPPQLLRGADAAKDQSYFLSSVPGSAFSDVAFPVGHLAKAEVRRLAADAGLPSASRRSSAGICFIGRRDFGGFIAEYAPPIPGVFVDVDSGAALGACANLAAVTHGQGAGISGLPEKVYVAGKDMQARVAHVARGRHHPALYSAAAALQQAHWIAGEPPPQLARAGMLACTYKARYRQTARSCTVRAGTDAFEPSRYCWLAGEGSAALHAKFGMPARAVTPQQAFVMYDGEVCLGSASVLQPGRTLHEMGLDVVGAAEEEEVVAA